MSGRTMGSFFGRRDSIGIEEVNEDPNWSIKFKHFIKYKRNKFWGYIVFIVTFLVTLTIGLLAVISESALHIVMYGKKSVFKSDSLLMVLILDFWMFSFNGALFYGLKLKNTVLIFLWMFTMLVNWNIYLYTRIFMLVDKSAADETTGNYLLMDTLHIILVLGIWLFLIAIIWDYWQQISNVTDIPEFLEVLHLWNVSIHS